MSSSRSPQQAAAATAPARLSPRSKNYLLCTALLVLVLTPLWAALLQWVIQPDLLTNPETTMTKRWAVWVGLPVAMILALSMMIWPLFAEPDAQPQRPSAAPARDEAVEQQTRREYVLEIISLGVTLDTFRQGALWDALIQGHPFASIRDLDPKHYEWSDLDKSGVSGGHASSALENAITPTPMYWVTPAFFGGPPAPNPEDQLSDTNPTNGMADGTRSAGLSWNLFAAAGWELAERPDRLMERVFAIFDRYPDLPYVVISSYDDMPVRNRLRPPGTPALVKDGYYVPEMPDTSAMFVLARRERIEPIRPFAFDDVDEDKVDMDTLNRRGVARRVFLAHADLEESVPQVKLPNFSPGRPVTVAEWLQASAAFAQRSDIHDWSPSLRHPLGNPRPPQAFKPTPWFPVPWNKEQLAAFDRLPTLGFLHRPVFVKTSDEHGQPLTRRDARAAALATGWQEALKTLPEAERKAAPAHVVVATGGNVEQTIALTTVLDRWTAQGGPTIDKAKANGWIDMQARLGNTGAASWPMAIAIGVLGSYREGGVSAAINLRDPAEASIVLISPPAEEKRRNQQSPLGGDVLRNHTTPAIDPDNYKQP